MSISLVAGSLVSGGMYETKAATTNETSLKDVYHSTNSKITVSNPVSNSYKVTTGTTGDGGADFAFDGNPDSHWHTSYTEGENTLASSLDWNETTAPNTFEGVENRAWIGGEFTEKVSLGKFTYQSRRNKNANFITQWALYVANSTIGGEPTDSEYKLVASGKWENSSQNTAKVETFTPVEATHFRLVAFTANQNHATASEIEMYELVPICESYYSFDNATAGGNLVDEWGSRHGSIQGNVSANGKSGNALFVESAGVGATLAADVELGNDWTIGYWVKSTGDIVNEVSILEDLGQEYSFSLKMAADRDSGFRVGNAGGDVLTFAHNFQKDTWYYITWTHSASGLSMYVNGQKIGNTNNWTASHAYKMPLAKIGGNGFTGLIDEIKVYNTALNVEQIQTIMQVPGLNVSAAIVDVEPGETYQIEAALIADGNETIVYSSDNTAVATVSETGLITAKEVGTATITLSAGEYSADIRVTVKPSILNKLPLYILDEQYQSDVEGAASTEEGTHANNTARKYLGQPDMVQTETGRLISVFPSGHGHGPLIMKISDDQGETWTEKTDIPESWAESQETPTIYSLQVDDGNGGTFERLVLVCACPNWDLKLGGWQMSYSDDNGNTWTPFENFWQEVDGNKNFTIVAMASLIQLKNEDGTPRQEWMGVYHNDAFVNYKTILTFDNDGNPQWTKPVAYLSEYRAIEDAHDICEVGMFRSPDGKRIVALGRNQTHAGPATMFYSDNEGETWSEPVELPGSLAGERHKALYDPVSGRLVITFREIDYDRDNDGVWEGGGDWTAGDWVAWVGTYDDIMNLRQGQYMIRLDEDFSANHYSGDCGYTGMAVLEDGTFVLHSYGHWDKAYSESYKNASGAYDVKTDLAWIRQAKFKLGNVENDNGLVNLTELTEKVAEMSNVSEADYTTTSWLKFASVFEKAQGMIINKDGQQIQVDAAVEALPGAYADLVPKGVHYYSFDEEKNVSVVTDKWGTRNSISNLGVFEEGYLGQGVRVTEQTPVTFDTNTTLKDNWTVGFWMKLDVNPTSQCLPIRTNNGNQGLVGLNIRRTGEKDEASWALIYENNKNDNYTVCDNTSDMDWTSWTYITIIKNQNEGLQYYRNGKCLKTEPWFITNNINTYAPIDVLGGIGFNGVIDEMAVYDYAMTAEQVKVSMGMPAQTFEFRGGSLREKHATLDANGNITQDQVYENGQKTSIRFGYKLYEVAGYDIVGWKWNWGTTEALGKTVIGINKVAVEGAEGIYTSNLVIQNVPVEAYNTTIYSKMIVTYKDKVTGELVDMETAANMRTIYNISEMMVERDPSGDGVYGQKLLDAYNAYTQQ